MLTTSSANIVFLPWTRQGAAATIPSVDSLGAQVQPGAATLTATLTVNSTEPVAMAVRLLGPSDAIGINANAIVRRDPPANTTHFEDNLFPSIEFDRPDFPWLFTPARADASARLRPWLCLIVVRKQAGVTLLPAINTPLPTLQIVAPASAAAELPDLADSWLWAHSQVASTGTANTNTLLNTLAGDSALSLSRLVCPRLLAPDTEYLACLVPSFEAGRKAGLGLPVDSAAALQPAWPFTANTPPAANVPDTATLPVYDHWTFRTGTGGDFKTLVTRLHAQPAPAGLGRRPIAIGKPGFQLPATFPLDAQLNLEGALLPLRENTAPAWPDGTMDAFQVALAGIVNAADTLASVDPLLAPPLYGRWHAAAKIAKREPPGLTWFDELNLDPRHRAVAAFGTRVVQEHQEALMASAWQQAGDLQSANQRLRQLQLSLNVGQSLHTRHFQSMQTDALLRVAAPAFARMRAAAIPGASATATVVTSLSATALPLQSMMPAMRKLSRARGPITRRLASAAGVSAGMNSFLSLINVAATLTIAPILHRADFAVVRQRLVSPTTAREYAQVTEATVAAMPPAPQYQLVAEGDFIPMPVPVRGSVRADNPVAAAFREAAKAHLAKLDPARSRLAALVASGTLDMNALSVQLRSQMQPQATLIALARAALPASGTTGYATSLDTIMHAPKFPQPMYEALRDLSQDLLLPGLDAVMPDSAIGLRTNQRFVDAYLVGLNFEMGRELLWRGFPTDQRGTYFDRFWDDAGNDAPHTDIPPLHQWGKRLLGASFTPNGERFVMLLRSELLRRYPTASIYAVPAILSNNKRVPNFSAATEIHPAFRGSLPPDVTFIGFNLTASAAVGVAGAGEGYFIVIQEQPGEPRFGLDSAVRTATAATGSTHLRTASGAPAGLPLRNLQWRKNSAHMAGITRRLPVRIAIHASRFIAPQDVP